MPASRVPQPSRDRMVPVPGHPLVVGVVPGQSDLIVQTAAAWSAALGGVPLVCAYADPTRVVVEERPDGAVRHTGLDPDQIDDSWVERSDDLRDHLGHLLGGHPAPWEFHYLAGRADRALTHLARAVDASAIIVGAKHPSSAERFREFLNGSVSVRLSRHQHRPVIIVPVEVVDWKAPTPW